MKHIRSIATARRALRNRKRPCKSLLRAARTLKYGLLCPRHALHNPRW